VKIYWRTEEDKLGTIGHRRTFSRGQIVNFLSGDTLS